MSLYRPGGTFSRRNSPLSRTVAFRPPRNSWWTSQKPSGRSGSERDATRVTLPVAGSPVGSTRRPAIVPPVSKATTIASLFRSGTRIVLVAYPSLRTRIHLSPLRARSSNLPWSSVWATPPTMAPFGPSSPSTSTVAATMGVPSLASVTCPERLRPRSSPASATNASTTPPQDATARTAAIAIRGDHGRKSARHHFADLPAVAPSVIAGPWLLSRKREAPSLDKARALTLRAERPTRSRLLPSANHSAFNADPPRGWTARHHAA